jgi:hypothetical protein
VRVGETLQLFDRKTGLLNLIYGIILDESRFLLDKAIQPIMPAAQAEEIKRQFGIMVETLRIDIRKLLKAMRAFGVSCREIHNEFRDEFREMRALMRLSFS